MAAARMAFRIHAGNKLVGKPFDRVYLTHLWNMLVLFIAFAIVVYKHATHSEVRHRWRMFFLGACEHNIPRQRGPILTEYSHITNLLVSFKVRSPVLRRPSPKSPPLPSLRPDLSLSFGAVFTFWNLISWLIGKWRAGRWKDRHSCLVSRILYCTSRSGIGKSCEKWDPQMEVELSKRGMHAPPREPRKFDERALFLLRRRRCGRWRC
jgi:hypothetical protein